LDDMRQLMTAYTDKDEDILITAPDAERAGLPDSSTVMEWIAAGAHAQLSPYIDAPAGKSLMTTPPKAGTVVGRDSIPALGVTTLTLSNGIKVVLKPTDFENDQTMFDGYSAGGTSLYSDSDFDVAANAAPLMGASGVDTLNAVQLSQLMNGKVVSVGTGVNERMQTVSGRAARTDLETALQLLYLRLTRPRMDTLVYHNMIARSRELLASRSASPEAVFGDTVNAVLGNYAYRSLPLTVERLQRVGLEKAYGIYKERFADLSGFTFVFVGNFTVDSLAPLLATYLGSLPALHRGEVARDLGEHLPVGQMVKKVNRGKENKATVRVVISGEYAYSAENNLSLRALSDILQIKVIQHLREDEGEVYSPQVRVSYDKYPRSRYVFTFSFGCAPANVDHLIEDVRQELAVLRDKGPQQEDVDKFKTAYLKQLEPLQRQNSYWLSYLSAAYQNGDDPLQITTVQQRLDRITAGSLQQAASQYLTGQNWISFELLPAE
jgi:zinc protease